jgi:hypothetical protein
MQTTTEMTIAEHQLTILQQLAERPQCFTSSVTGDTYNIAAAWKCIIANPREAEKMNIKKEREAFLIADVDRVYAAGLTAAQLSVPVLAFVTPQRMLHIMDGWHRLFSLTMLDAEFGYAYVLTDDELKSVTFADQHEVVRYQKAAIDRDPSILEHGITRVANTKGWPREAVARACNALNRDNVPEALAVLEAAGIPLIEFMEASA